MAEYLRQWKIWLWCFIELRNAFDTVNHFMLLKKMDHYGIRGIALDCFSSYLTEKKQFESVNDHISDYPDICCGVPQGSVLGPLLFPIYINDLPNVSSSYHSIFFADDTNIYFEATDLVSFQKNNESRIEICKNGFMLIN